MENPTFTASSLLCTESVSSLNDELEEGDDCTLITAEDEDDDGYIQILFDREIAMNGGVQKLDLSQVINENWVQKARSDAIDYILETGGLFGFRMQTSFLSISYLDRFLSRKSIDGEKYWAIKLLAIACLSLAAKMEEFSVPSLSQYPMEDFTFKSSLIQRMELLVLNTLDWKLGFITPLAFTHYFLSKFSTVSERKSAAVSRTMEIILSVIRDANLMSHRPSVVAAAATLLALDGGLIKESMELKINALPSGGCLKLDDVLSCYNQMREMEKNEFPKPCTVASSLGSKRKRTDDDVLGL
nr:cyclin-D5-1-like isoform X1 [Ipomoea trifida]